MARTKNRALADGKKSGDAMAKLYKLGAYVRLSKASDYSNSESIENQKIILKQYIDEHDDLELYSFYEDDGATGTNFNRFGFDKMIDDVRRGIINGVIVKDSTRFGREHLIVGEYIEKIFPFLGIRFISVLDHYDSMESGCDHKKIGLTMKNIVSEIYSKDISKKIYSSYRVTQKSGEAKGGNTVPYGYIVKKGEKEYSVDYRAAKIVRKIAGWLIGGNSIRTVIKKLYKKNILTPTQHRRTGKIYGDDKTEALLWGKTTICKMIRNLEYTGTRVVHKTECFLTEGIEPHELPKEDYILIAGKNPVIIRTEIFERLQKIMDERKAANKHKGNIKSQGAIEENIFKGLIYCGECNSSMIRLNNKNKYRYFVCSLHNRATSLCQRESIKELELRRVIIKAIQVRIQLIYDVDTKLEHMYHNMFCGNYFKKKQEVLLRKAQQLEIIRRNHYFDFVEKRISKEQLAAEREHYQLKKTYIQSSLEELAEKKTYLKKLEQYQYMIMSRFLVYEKEVFDIQHADYSQLSEDMVAVFVCKILVFSNKRIEIIFKFEDELQELLIAIERYSGSEV